MRWATSSPISCFAPTSPISCFGLPEHAKHEMGDVGARNEEAAPEVLPVRRPVAAGHGFVGEPWRSYDGPVQAAVPKDVLHQREVGVVLPERGFDQRTEQVPHEEPIARVVLRRLRAARRRNGPDRGGADDDDAAYPGCLHRLDDGPRALPGDSGLGRRTRTKPGEHRVGSFDCGLERCRVRSRQVGRDDAYLSGQLLRISHDGRDVVTCGDGLFEGLPTDTPGRGKDRELHPSLPWLVSRSGDQDHGTLSSVHQMVRSQYRMAYISSSD